MNLFWRGFRQGWREGRLSERAITSCAVFGALAAALALVLLQLI